MSSPAERSAIRFGLRSKLTAVLAAQTLLIIILILVVQQFNLRRAIVRQTIAQGKSVADVVASTSTYYVVFGLADDLQNTVRDLGKHSNVQYADFVSADGKIMASTGLRPNAFNAPPSSPTAVDSSAHIDGEELYLFVRPFFSADGEQGATATSPVGFFRLAINEEVIREAARSSLLLNLGVGLAALILSVAIAGAVSRVIARPILDLVESSTQISGGDLTQRVESQARDELGALSGAFNSMAGNLEHTVSKVGESNQKLRSVSETVASRSISVIAGVDEQQKSIDRTYLSIDQLNTGLQRISENLQRLSAASEQTSSSILEMVASIAEVSRHTDSLVGAVEDTASATNQMVSSIGGIDKNAEFLQSFMSETAASMVEMNASISQVETTAARSRDLSLAVAQSADSGMKAVTRTMEGMTMVRKSVRESSLIISQLGQRSLEIGKILRVIDDIADQTNLLALNAAILAAQAGERGTGFSVVAGEIRELSEKTASSTKEISNLIQSVQKEVDNASVSMSEVSKTVEGGVELSRESVTVLSTILDSATRSADMSRQIAVATREQAQGSQSVSTAIDRVQEMVRQINHATSEQAAGSQHILRAVETMREGTRHVRQAMHEQEGGSLTISEASEEMIGMIRDIFDVNSNQAAESENIVETMEQLRRIAAENRTSAHDMNDALQLLTGAIRSLDDQLRKFKTRG